METNEYMVRYERQAVIKLLAVEREIHDDIHVLTALRGLFDSIEHVNREQFKIFSHDLMVSHTSIQALEWIPRVPMAERAAYEARARQDGYDEFSFLERGADKTLVPVLDREEYFPVYYVEPMIGNEKALGFDLASNERRKAALLEAWRSNEEVATAKITLVQEKGSQSGMLVFLPVFKGGSEVHGGSFQEAPLLGFALGVYRVGDMVEKALADLHKDTYFTIIDVTDDQNRELLYGETDIDASNFQAVNGVFFKKEINVAGRKWLCLITPSHDDVELSIHTRSLTLLLVSLAVTFLATLLIRNLLASRARIESEVERKTLEIRETQESLKEANAELEEFAYRTSHDLRSPIISAQGLLKIAEKQILDDNPDKARQSLELLDSGLDKLKNLIEDLLQLTRTKNAEEELTELNVTETIDDAIDKFAHMENFQRLYIQKDLEWGGALLTKKSRFVLIVENLISNAIKYQDVKEEQSYIKIISKKENGHFLFTIEDNGLGIPEDNQDDMFQMFKRFHSRTSYGSGLGLYMMKKSADVLGGEITYQSLEKGSCFQLRTPCE